MEKQLTLKNDLIFKIFFGKTGNEKYLTSFLDALLDFKIEKIEIIQESNLKQMSKDTKLGRLDLKVTINDNSIINVEIQMKNYHNTEQRTTYYGSRLISEQLAKSDKYEQIKPVILINILDYNFIDLPDYHTETVTVAKEHRDYELVKDLKYHFIELPKFRKSKPELANALECWLAFIDYSDGGLIDMAQEKENIIKEAKEDLDEILSSQAIKEIIDYEESALKEKATIQAYERKYGREEGRAEGLAEGREEGRKEGRKEGRAEGKREVKLEIAKEMLKHNMDINTVIQFTKLPMEEIEQIKLSLGL